jgi:hypothetical protein
MKNVHDKLNSDPKTASDAALIANVPADLDTLEKGENWLKQTVTDPQKQASIIKPIQHAVSGPRSAAVRRPE